MWQNIHILGVTVNVIADKTEKEGRKMKKKQDIIFLCKFKRDSVRINNLIN